jgi:hypothetical protein
MSHWPGGFFHGIPDVEPTYVPKGYYSFDSYGRLEKATPERNASPLATRKNPLYGRSHNQLAPPAFRLPAGRSVSPRVQDTPSGSDTLPGSSVRVGKSVLDNWRASLSDAEDLVNELVDSRRDSIRFASNEARMRRLLADLRRAVRNGESVVRSAD